MTKRKNHKVCQRGYDGKIIGWGSYPTYEIGEKIRFIKKYNYVKGVVVSDPGGVDYLVTDKTKKIYKAWKGCILPDLS